MSPPSPTTSEKGDVTELLLAWGDGDVAARDQLIPLVRDELRRIAKMRIDREPRKHTYQPEDLVHDLYLRLVDRRRVNWRNRAHFFGSAATTMREILVDRARRRLAKKRGEGYEFVPLDEARDAAERQDLELVALDDSLSDFAKIDERRSRAVEMSYFAGMTHEEIAEVLDVSAETVKRDCRLARAWLREQLRPEDDETG